MGSYILTWLFPGISDLIGVHYQSCTLTKRDRTTFFFSQLISREESLHGGTARQVNPSVPLVVVWLHWRSDFGLLDLRSTIWLPPVGKHTCGKILWKNSDLSATDIAFCLNIFSATNCNIGSFCCHLLTPLTTDVTTTQQCKRHCKRHCKRRRIQPPQTATAAQTTTPQTIIPGFCTDEYSWRRNVKMNHESSILSTLLDLLVLVIA